MPKKRKIMSGMRRIPVGDAATEQAAREAQPEIDLEATRTPSGRGYLGPMPSQLAPTERYEGLSPIAHRQNLAQLIAQATGQSLWEVDRQYEGVPLEQMEDDIRALQERQTQFRPLSPR